MFPVSERFRRALKRSHTPIFRCDVLRAGDEDLVRIDGQAINLKMLPGSKVTFAADDAARTSAQLSVVDTDGILTPDLAEDVLSPFTAELALWRGIRFEDGEEELPPLGRFKMTDFQVSENDGGPVYTLTLLDLSIESDDPLEKVHPIDAGTSNERAVIELLLAAYPLYRFRLPATGRITPSLIIPEDASPWAEARLLMRSAGYELFMDRDGYVTAAPVRLEAANEYQWVHDENAESDFVNPSQRVSRDQVKNVVKVVGTSSQNVSGVEGVAFDDDPTSPTYIGTIGPKVKKVESPIVRSDEQANQMAAAILGRLLGPGREVDVDVIPNPALDPFDTVLVRRERLGLQRRLLASRFDLPMDSETESMPLTLRHSILAGSEL